MAIEVEGFVKGLKCWIFENKILWDIPFRQNIRRMKARTMQKLLNKVQSFINLEEKLNTQFDNLVIVGANSSRSTRKDSHPRKDESNRGIHDRYDIYQ